MAAHHTRLHLAARHLGVFGLSASLLYSGLPAFAHAQVTPPITPSGLNTQISKPIPVTGGKTQYDITGGTRPGNGSNLFHSFGEFGVPTNNIANFLNDSGLTTSNILGRVTGGNPSNIFGMIQTTAFGNANLFLMNPAGIVFGPNATLNVGGSVHFTTANYLRLTDGVRFTAVPGAQDPLLSIAPVAAFGFLNQNPAPIIIQGSVLSVPEGQTISLVGGNVTIQAGVLEDGTLRSSSLFASNGQISLASTASPGEFLMQGLQPAPNVNGESFTSFGTINLAQGSAVAVSGSGTVAIRGGQFVLELENSSISTAEGPAPADSVMLSNGSSIVTSTSGSDAGANVEITTPNLTMDGASVLTTQTFGDGIAGDISLNVGSLILHGGSIIQTVNSSFGNGQGGALLVQGLNGTGLAETVIISGRDNVGNPSGLFSDTQIFGNGGPLTVKAKSLNMDDGGTITANTFGAGRGGDIVLEIQNLNFSNGAFIQSHTDSFGGGPAGNIIVRGLAEGTAADSVVITGQDGQGSPSGIFSNTFGDGHPGDISLDTRSLVLASGARIGNGTVFDVLGGNVTVTAQDSVVISGGSNISSQAFATGAGQVHISTSALILDNGTINTSTLNVGRGGDVVLDLGRLNLMRGSQITSETRGPGAGGNVIVQGPGGDGNAASSVSLSGGSLISAKSSGAGAGPAGSVTINAGVFHSDNSIVTTAADAARGGDISITAQQIQLSDGAVISGRSFGSGTAGNISITTRDSLVINNSTITTQAELADGGDITINALNMVQLINSRISSSVGNATKTDTVGGNITIDPHFFILQNSQIVANAFAGTGGNIRLVADVFLADPSTIINASSTLGVNGTVNIQSPVQNLSGTLSPLPAGLLKIAPLTSACAARAQGGTFSSFTVAGRDGVPAEPGGLLPSPLQQAGLSLTTGREATTSGDPGMPIPVLLSMNWDGRCSQ
jgi:filamentous hemagglutinin family protein